MKRHVLITGEIGAGKSTALLRTLALLGDIRAQGVQTYYMETRGEETKTLYLRAWGSGEQGAYLTQVPGGGPDDALPVFDAQGTALLDAARETAQVIVIDECGRLERDAHAYHEALRRCVEGDVPVLCAIRKHKAPWAGWLRAHPAVTLLEADVQNRDDIPQQAAALVRSAMKTEA